MTRWAWSEQWRVTLWAWLATVGASAMVWPLVEDHTYLVHGGGGAAVVTAVGAVLRARRLPWPVILLVQLATLTQWCVLVYARGEALLGVVPTKAALVELGHRIDSFIDVSNQYVAPVPDHPDITMALAVFMLALGLAVDAVAVTFRKVPLVGLLFLAIYMAPVSLLGGDVSWFVFLPGAAGFVFLLAADERERLIHWGRQIRASGSTWEDPREESDPGGIRAVGRRIGLGAVAAAVVLPALIPTLSPQYFGESGSGGGEGSTGAGETRVSNPVLDLKRNLTEQNSAVLVRFSTDQPDPSYLRIASLDDFTGNQWQPGARSAETGVSSDAELPRVPGLGSTVPRASYRYDVEITDELDSSWLPLVYAPTTIQADQRWNVDEINLDATATEDDQSTAGTRYSFTTTIVQPTALMLRGSTDPPEPLAPFTALPSGLPPVIAAEARKVTAGATTPFDQAIALQAWFRNKGGFRYSIEAEPGTGLETIESFLTSERVGYCEQFASAMALMARALNIPARVAVGFLQPESIGAGQYQYRGTDMHTWPELFFEGVGWVRFEPTPAVRTGDAPDFANSAQGTQDPGQTGGPTDDPLPREELAIPEDPAAASTGSGDDGSGLWTAAAGGIGGGALLLVLAATPRLLRAARSRSRWGGADHPAAVAEAAWAELRDNVLDLRLPWDAGATPRGMGRQLRARIREEEGCVRALNRIVLATEQGRYARAVRDPHQLRQAVDTVTAALAATRSARQRWWATWLPVSLIRPYRPDRAGRPVSGEALVMVTE